MRITVRVAGFVAGVLVAISQVIFQVSPPPAYGICIACHTRDLVNWFTNRYRGSNYGPRLPYCVPAEYRCVYVPAKVSDSSQYLLGHF